MKILYFGDYESAYARNRVLLRGLKLNKVTVVECVTKKKGRAGRIDLQKQLDALTVNFDCVIVGYSDSRWVVPLIKKYTNKPIVWDAFYSKYDAWVLDKKVTSRLSVKAVYYWFSDWYSCWLADVVLLDTQAQVDFFHKQFFVAKHKLAYLYVGTDDAVMKPRATEAHTDFVVSFLGKYIPLQGPQYIIQAAKLLEQDKRIRFQMIGSGQLYAQCVDMATELGLSNITFIKPIPYESIPQMLAVADVCLGIFGDTDKTQRVIPNKVFEAAALQKAIISADTPAIRELFTDQYDIVLCPTADPEALAQTIVALSTDVRQRAQLGIHAAQTVRTHATPQGIGQKLCLLLHDILD